jgi:hypothetical protein
MAKTKRRRAESSREPPSRTEETGDRPTLFEPLPPPGRNKPLLILAAAMVLGWIAALLWLVLAT